MYKRPPLRVREEPLVKQGPIILSPDSFLARVLIKQPTKFESHVKYPVYRKDDYLNLLEKNYKELGIVYKKPEIPDYVPTVTPIIEKEPQIDFIDQVCLKYKILKSGIVRIKLDASFAALYEKYYKQCKQPSIKLIIQAYKSMGFSDGFLDKIKKNFTKKVEYQKTVDKLIDRIFEKEPVKKPKKKKEEEIRDEENLEERDDEEEEEQDEEHDDEGMDVEIDEELDEQPQEEEYFSDGGD